MPAVLAFFADRPLSLISGSSSLLAALLQSSYTITIALRLSAERCPTQGSGPFRDFSEVRLRLFRKASHRPATFRP
jgi:hypothetical protein